jgi:anti-anti-sigma factor
MEPQFAAQVQARNGVARVAVAGELDVAAAPVLDEHLTQFEGNGVKAILVDLSELTFLDCSGLSVFLAARHRAEANGHRLVLFGANPTARRVFELTGTERLFDEQGAMSGLDQFHQGGTVATVPLPPYSFLGSPPIM